MLEAGSGLGYLVYPALESHESYYLDYQGEGRYRFVFYLKAGEKWEPLFGVLIVQPIGGAGMFREEVSFMTPTPTLTRERALQITRMCIVPEDLGTPAGAVSLRGNWNFRTPPGWDTVYTPIFNVIDRPIAPMLVIRVETDWYSHETEFRYVLQPGEGMSGQHSMPIGQVVFVPREEITLHDCSEDEIRQIRQEQAQFATDKAAVKQTSSYGLPYSPHYARMSRGNKQPERDVAPGREVSAPGTSSTSSPLPESVDVSKVGRNDPCPCGSGKKFKKCHGTSATS